MLTASRLGRSIGRSWAGDRLSVTRCGVERSVESYLVRA